MSRESATESQRGMSTHSVHAGERLPVGDGHPTSSPIHIASAYFYDETDDLDAAFADSSRGYVYSRFGNPTVTGLETAIATLEGTDTAIAFASGMAAIHAAIAHAVAPGESIVVSQDVYGATFALLKDILTDSGITPHFVDILDLEAVASLVRKTKAQAILAETASNPLIRVADVSALGTIAAEAGAKLIIDNTFLSPVVSRPALLGADYVVHSTTKYLGGHGDSTGGAIATTEANAAAIRQRLKLTGAILSPFEGWLIHRGIKTLPLRMRQHCANAQIIADWLNSESRIDTVFYPGISQVVPDGVFSGDARGAMVAFEIGHADRDAVFRFLDALTMIIPAPTLGDVYSLILYPAIASHRGLSPEQRADIGIKDNLVRLSVGIEDSADIIADLKQALDAAVSQDETKRGRRFIPEQETHVSQ